MNINTNFFSIIEVGYKPLKLLNLFHQIQQHSDEKFGVHAAHWYRKAWQTRPEQLAIQSL